MQEAERQRCFPTTCKGRGPYKCYDPQFKDEKIQASGVLVTISLIGELGPEYRSPDPRPGALSNATRAGVSGALGPQQISSFGDHVIGGPRIMVLQV